MDTQIAMDGLRASQAAAGHGWASAQAAWWIGSAALILNAVGIYFLRKQIIENTAAIKASAQSAFAAARAADIAYAAYRPWISIDAVGITSVTYDAAEERNCLIQGNIVLRNVGGAPALATQVNVSIGQFLGKSLTLEEITATPGVSLYADTIVADRSEVLPFIWVCNWEDLATPTRGSFDLLLSVHYNAPNGNSGHQLVQMWGSGSRVFGSTIQGFTPGALEKKGRINAATKRLHTMVAT